MKNIKRVSKGGYVQADTTGTGTWEIGRIQDFNDTHVWFRSVSDMEIIKIRRDEAFKATPAEYEAACKQATQDKKDVIMAKAAAKLPLQETGLTDLAEEDEVLEDVEGMGEEEGEEEEEDKSKSIVKKSYKKRYNKVKVSGKTTQNCGDLVSERLLGKTLDEIYVEVAEALEADVDDLAARYEHLNPGQQRMVLGNRLRALYKKEGLI